MAKEKEELEAEFREIFDYPKLSDFNLTFDRAGLVDQIIHKDEARAERSKLGPPHAFIGRHKPKEQ